MRRRRTFAMTPRAALQIKPLVLSACNFAAQALCSFIGSKIGIGRRARLQRGTVGLFPAFNFAEKTRNESSGRMKPAIMDLSIEPYLTFHQRLRFQCDWF